MAKSATSLGLPHVTYLTGDYTSPLGSIDLGQGTLSSRCGLEARWRPLRNGLHAQGRRRHSPSINPTPLKQYTAALG